MRLVDALTTIGSMGAPVFTTRQAATCLRVPNAHASVLLARLAAAGHLVRLRHGVWAAPGADLTSEAVAQLNAASPSEKAKQ